MKYKTKIKFTFSIIWSEFIFMIENTWYGKWVHFSVSPREGVANNEWRISHIKSDSNRSEPLFKHIPGNVKKLQLIGKIKHHFYTWIQDIVESIVSLKNPLNMIFFRNMAESIVYDRTSPRDKKCLHMNKVSKFSKY